MYIMVPVTMIDCAGEWTFQGTEDTSEARRDQTVILHQPPVGRFFSRSAEELQPGEFRGKTLPAWEPTESWSVHVSNIGQVDDNWPLITIDIYTCICIYIYCTYIFYPIPLILEGSWNILKVWTILSWGPSRIHNPQPWWTDVNSTRLATAVQT